MFVESCCFMPTIPTQNIEMGGKRFYSKWSNVLFFLAKGFFSPHFSAFR